MKILIYTDNHWCQYSSILRRRGEKYSFRLENQIKSINWAENLSKQLSCSMVVHCGDFFDRESLNSEELTALSELQFNQDAEHIMLVGNHEMGINTLDYSSMHLFALDNMFNVINKPVTIELDDFHQLCFLPYILEYNRKSIKDYFPETPKKRIIFSHNDIQGIQLGKFVTNSGFSMDDIEQNCDLFINGHLHNGTQITNKIFNVGNLTGQNFSEDGFQYPHVVYVIDTNLMRIDVYENPYAINFYKVDFTQNDSIDYINEISSKMKNAVVTIKCYSDNYSYLKVRFGKEVHELIPHHSSIIESRFIVVNNSNMESDTEEKIKELSVDHLEEFKKYVLLEIGTDEIILDELKEIFV